MFSFFPHTPEIVIPGGTYFRKCLKMLGGKISSNILAFVSRCEFVKKKNEVNIKVKCWNRRFVSHGVCWNE